jgi:hypothetical protein
MKLEFSIDARGRGSDLYIQRRVGKQPEKGATIELRRNGNENNGNTGYRSKQSRPTVSTRLDLYQHLGHRGCALCLFPPAIKRLIPNQVFSIVAA